LRDYFLHQFSITDAAYAVLPHAVAGLRGVPVAERTDYLLDLAFIEAARLGPYAPPLPKDLADAYQSAVIGARAIACEGLGAGLSKPDFRYLLCSISALHGHPGLGRMLLHLEALEPEEVTCSGYCE
jgi:hypothetical protein